MKFIILIMLSFIFLFSAPKQQTFNNIYAHTFLLKEKVMNLKLQVKNKTILPLFDKQINKLPRNVYQKC